MSQRNQLFTCLTVVSNIPRLRVTSQQGSEIEGTSKMSQNNTLNMNSQWLAWIVDRTSLNPCRRGEHLWDNLRLLFLQLVMVSLPTIWQCSLPRNGDLWVGVAGLQLDLKSFDQLGDLKLHIIYSADNFQTSLWEYLEN